MNKTYRKVILGLLIAALVLGGAGSVSPVCRISGDDGVKGAEEQYTVPDRGESL